PARTTERTRHRHHNAQHRGSVATQACDRIAVASAPAKSLRGSTKSARGPAGFLLGRLTDVTLKPDLRGVLQLPVTRATPMCLLDGRPRPTRGKAGLRWCFIGVLVSITLPSTISAHGQEADLVLHHGKVVTVDRDFSIHQALAVRQDRIIRVGTDLDVLKTRGPKTEVIDLAGRMVLPGLIDSHTHPSDACLTEFDHPVPQMETISDVLEYIRARARAVGPGRWVIVRQVFITRLKEQRYPTRNELDQVAPENPV